MSEEGGSHQVQYQGHQPWNRDLTPLPGNGKVLSPTEVRARPHPHRALLLPEERKAAQSDTSSPQLPPGESEKPLGGSLQGTCRLVYRTPITGLRTPGSLTDPRALCWRLPEGAVQPSLAPAPSSAQHTWRVRVTLSKPAPGLIPVRGDAAAH